MSNQRKNITVAVTLEHYREIRHLAVEYDTTVTALVAYLLKRLPDALRRAKYPKPEAKRPTSQPNALPSSQRTQFRACAPGGIGAQLSPDQSAPAANPAPILSQYPSGPSATNS